MPQLALLGLSMFYNLSITAQRSIIEKNLGIKFKYPELYRPRTLVNGLEENTVPIVCMNQTGLINFAIWGLLPEGSLEDWSLYQNQYNTLNILPEVLEDLEWCSQAIVNRRCLIIATGFFTSYWYNGLLYPFYVYHYTRQPLYLAGVYSQLDDGFLTCALLLVRCNAFLKTIQNTSHSMPLMIMGKNLQEWLDPSSRSEGIINRFRSYEQPHLSAHTISRDFYYQHFDQDALLTPVEYHELPLFQLGERA